MQSQERDNPVFCRYQFRLARLSGVDSRLHRQLQRPLLIDQNALQHWEVLQRLPEEDRERHGRGFVQRA